MDIYTLDDMAAALQGAQYGDVLLFNIKNDITFTSALLLNESISINLVNGSGQEIVALTIAGGGSFRHFTTAGASINNLSLAVGSGIILDGGGTGGGMQIFGSGCLLALDNCALIKCFNSSNGGAILLQGNVSRNSLLMHNVLIENCSSNAAGGGIFASDCSLKITGSAILGNRARTLGGGIQTMAGANRLGSILTLAGSIISGNIAQAALSDGGGINAYDTILTIEGSEISNNVADNYGGGLHMKFYALSADDSALIIRNSFITGNRTRNSGGGIGVETAIREFTITNCTINENPAIST